MNKKNKILILCFTAFVVSVASFAQNTLSEKPDSTLKRKISLQNIKLNFDDDFFNFTGRSTDQYYTGGWQVDAFYKRNYNNNPVFDALLMKLPESSNLYFYGIERKIYTPIDLSSKQIVYDDRPYASVGTVQHGVISSNHELNETLSTEVGIGAIGPITHGGEEQIWFHNLIGAPTPMGWDNQIRNDFIFDYKVNYERQVIKPMENLVIQANFDCEAGTLVDNSGIGVTMAFGSFNKLFTKDNLQIPNSNQNPNKLMIHFYMHPEVRVVMYNATLEGGVFSNSSPYVLNSNDINYVYLQYDLGIVIVYKGIGFSLSQKTRTAEFKTGQIQQIGSITLTLPI